MGSCDAQGPPPSDRDSDSLTVRLPELEGSLGDTLRAPIEIDSLQKDVTSYQFTLLYDPSTVQILGTRVEETMTPSHPVVNDQSEEKQFAVSFAAAEALENGGPLLILEFELVGTGTAALSFSEFQLFDQNGDEVSVALDDGSVLVQ